MKLQRGEQGYLKARKRGAFLNTLLMVGIGFAIFIVGLLLNKMEPANIFTVAGFLMILPAAKSLVAVIVLSPYRETKEEDRKRLASYAMENDTLLYDVVFTSSEKIMHLNCVYVTEHQILGISLRKKDDLKVIKEYLEKELKARCIPYVVFLTDSEDALKKRMALRQTNEKEAQSEVVEMLRTFTI